MLSRLRTLLFWCHLAIGVAVAVVVLIMSATGVLLTFEKQIVLWAETRGISASSPAGVAGARPPSMPTDSLIARARAVAGRAPTAVTWRAALPGVVQVAFGRERVLYMDARTGAVAADGNGGVRRFFTWVTGWHRWMGATARDQVARERGKAITGAANLGFLFLVSSGIWLWWPRNRAPGAVRRAATLRRGLSGKARDFNWHNAIGVWAFAPLLIVVASGAVISYTWAGALVYRAVGEQPPAPQGGAASGAGDEEEPRVPAGIDPMRASAAARNPEWRIITLQLPRSAKAPLSFSVDGGTGGQPQKRGTLTFDQTTGAEREWQPFAAQSRGRRARSVLRFAHTGEVLGIPGQLIAGLASLGAVVLVYSGLALSVRRLVAWVRRRRRRAAEEAVPRAPERLAA